MLPLTQEDRALINKFLQASDSEKENIIRSNAVEVNVRIAEHHREFESFCQRGELDHFWKQHWSVYGSIFCIQQGLTSCLFYSHSHEAHFNLVRGAYFYYRSQLIARSSSILFSEAEVACLHDAMKFDSVHALQRYNQYCYHNIEAALSEEDEKKLYLTIIANSKKMLPNYGAYGYMVYGESLGNYAIWLEKNHFSVKATYFMEAAEQAYLYAATTLNESQHSIHNASFGQGLASSNAARIADPGQASTSLREQFEAVIQSNTSVRFPS